MYVAFTQHCIQSTVTDVGGVECYCTAIYSGLSPLSGGKAVYLSQTSWAFTSTQLVSPRRHCFDNFVGVVNYKGDCRQDAQL